MSAPGRVRRGTAAGPERQGAQAGTHRAARRVGVCAGRFLSRAVSGALTTVTASRSNRRRGAERSTKPCVSEPTPRPPARPAEGRVRPARVLAAADAYDTGEDPMAGSSAAKLFWGEAVRGAADRGVQVHGGPGRTGSTLRRSSGDGGAHARISGGPGPHAVRA
ncbi:acyl-CoA dehydrogenase family protein [Streptomyces sp. NPDC086519]|uniref:acyl-CoA dehydrogenase family protein n=1 Tax=Streptomyces sp. NPDC086519 TaxID=3154863 RepID=UPI0034448CFE